MERTASINEPFWRGRRVLLTGFTGFKGSWLWSWLEKLGAELTGLALPPDSTPSMAHLLGLCDKPGAVLGDIRDRRLVRETVARADPQVVFHLAAQALVRRSYAAPLETFDTNVTGTLALLDTLREAPSLGAVLIATSDKVYENDGSGRLFDEGDRLGGADPYSASKAACEIAVSGFARSFFAQGGSAHRPVAVATARAGNVIGGGDWSADRIIPDLWRARRAGQPAILRHPQATRPWQHVLDPIRGYLLFAQALSAGLKATTLNFGPSDATVLPVGALADALAAAWPGGHVPTWVHEAGQDQPPESAMLAIDSSLAGTVLGWHARLGVREAVDWTARWYDAHDRGAPMTDFTLGQIEEYESLVSGEEASAP